MLPIEEMAKYIKPRPYCDEAHGDSCECSADDDDESCAWDGDAECDDSDGTPEAVEGDETTPLPAESMAQLIYRGAA